MKKFTDVSNFISNGSILDKEKRKILSNILFNHFYEIEYNGTDELNSLKDKECAPYIASIERLFNDKILKYTTINNEILSKKITLDILKWIESKYNSVQQSIEFQNHDINFNKFNENKDSYTINDWYKLLNELKDTYPNFGKYWDFYEKKLKELYEQIKELQKNNKNKQIEELTKELNTVHEKITEDYKDAFDEKIEEIANEYMRLETEEYLEYLTKYIEKLSNFYNMTNTFFGYLGRFWDLSEEAWQNVDWNEIEIYAKLLEKNKDIQELAEMMGRLQEADDEYEKELIEKTIITHEWKIDSIGKSEIKGVHFSDDLNSLLPSEVALLSNPETELDFAKRFVEKKLLTFEHIDRYKSELEQKELEEIDKKKEDKKGPIIACVDTSGSMHGVSERVAKIIVFALLKIALKENRKCYLISFSTGIKTIELTDMNHSMEKLINFLKMSFHGGTDAISALYEALKMLNTKEYKKADVVMISDFIMSLLSNDLQNDILKQKETKTKFHSVVISNQANYNVLDVFDTNWAFNNVGNLNNINELSSFSRMI